MSKKVCKQAPKGQFGLASNLTACQPKQSSTPFTGRKKFRYSTTQYSQCLTSNYKVNLQKEIEKGPEMTAMIESAEKAF